MMRAREETIALSVEYGLAVGRCSFVSLEAFMTTLDEEIARTRKNLAAGFVSAEVIEECLETLRATAAAEFERVNNPGTRLPPGAA
jgi:hypothetical protein